MVRIMIRYSDPDVEKRLENIEVKNPQVWIRFDQN